MLKPVNPIMPAKPAPASCPATFIGACQGSLRRLRHRALLGICCLALAGLASAPALALSVPQPTAVEIGAGLAQRLEALGSFEADYRAISPHTQAELSLIVNQARRYALYHLVSTGEVETDYWIVLDFAQSGPTGQRYQMYLLSPEGGQHFALVPDEILSRADTPMGVFYFFTEQFLRHQPTGGSPELASLNLMPRTPMLSMGLSEAQLQLSLGVSSNPRRLSASWLEDRTLSEAVSVSQAPQSVRIIYPGQHEISLDPNTGLIQLEQWPLPESGQREIRLLRQGALRKDLPYAELIPGFKELKLIEQAPDNLVEQFHAAFFSQLAAALPGLPGFGRLAGPELGAYQDKVFAAAREKVRGQARALVGPENAKAFARGRLFPAYASFRQEPGHADASFADFLAIYREQLVRNPDAVAPPEAAQVLIPLVEALRTLLGSLSEAERKPLVELYELNIDPLASAWKLELAEAHFAHLEALGLRP